MQAQQLGTTDAALSWSVEDPYIVNIPARFDAVVAPVIESNIALLSKTGLRDFVLDAAQTTFMTGASLRAMLAMARLLQQMKGRLVVSNLSGQPRAIFDACGYDGLIAVFAERQNALDAFAGR